MPPQQPIRLKGRAYIAWGGLSVAYCLTDILAINHDINVHFGYLLIDKIPKSWPALPVKG